MFSQNILCCSFKIYASTAFAKYSVPFMVRVYSKSELLIIVNGIKNTKYNEIFRQYIITLVQKHQIKRKILTF